MKRREMVILAIIMAVAFSVAAAAVVLLVSTYANHKIEQEADEKFTVSMQTELGRTVTDQDKTVAKTLCNLFDETQNVPLVMGELFDEETISTMTNDSAADAGTWVRITVDSYCPDFKRDLNAWSINR